MDNELKAWTIAFIKNRDLVHRKLEKIEEKEDHLICHHKDKTQHYYMINPLTDKVFLLKGDSVTAVCHNEEQNLMFLVKNWGKASKIKNLSFIFVNLKNTEKWIINPYLHSLIADPASIPLGLRAMYDTANGKVLDIPKGKKKSSMFEEGSDSEETEEE